MYELLEKEESGTKVIKNGFGLRVKYTSWGEFLMDRGCS